MIQKLEIPCELCDLNTYINAERIDKFKAAKIKKEQTELVMWYAKLQLQTIKNPARFEFRWYTENAKKDPDNICFAKKYILDGIKEAGKIANDGRGNVVSFKDEFFIDKKNPRIEVVIFEILP